MINGELLM